jgi:hypothetical protein
VSRVSKEIPESKVLRVKLETKALVVSVDKMG